MQTHLRRVRALSTAALAAVVFAACGGGGGDTMTSNTTMVATETIAAVLSADQETPGVDSGAIGSATFTLDRATRTLSGSVTVDGTTPTLGHIHAGEAGSAGGVSIALAVSPDSAVSLPSTVLTAEQLAQLDAGTLYVNIHSATHAGGEIRGQIGREIFRAVLSGAQETTPVASSASGRGRIVLDPVTRTISGELQLDGIAATAAHIHAGAFGSNGGIVVNLEDHGGHGHYTVPANTVLTPAQADSLRAGALYFNAHSAANPGGEIRGQIGRRVLQADASGAQEVPANGSPASGRAFVTYDPATRRIEGRFTVSGMTATVAHIHMAAAGSNGAIVVGLAETAPGVWSVPADTQLTPGQARALLAGGLYVNAHSAAFAGGEIRGQLTAQ